MSTYPFTPGAYATGADALAQLSITTPVGATDPVSDIDDALHQIKKYLKDIKGPEARIQDALDPTKPGGLFDLTYPVGSVYTTTDKTFDPNVSFYGTWVQVAKKMNVYGYDASDAGYDETGDASTEPTTPWTGQNTHSHGVGTYTTDSSAIGGSVTLAGSTQGHALVEAEIPAHTHTTQVGGGGSNSSNTLNGNQNNSSVVGSHTTSSYGGGASHSHGLGGLGSISGGDHTHTVSGNSDSIDNRVEGFIAVIWERTV